MGEGSKKLNCWEYMDCGLDPGGPKADESGACPAARAVKLDGSHGGVNGGRACWVVQGTMCGGEIQGSFGEKFSNCCNCDFYQHVRKEEGGNFQLSAMLLDML